MDQEIDAGVEALYGHGIDWARETGLVHVSAIHGPSGRIIAIGPHAPASPTDRFVLGFARARADVIVTTGSILRAEPDLVHRYAESPSENAAWAGWRRTVLDRASAPRLLILSASGRFPMAHPALVDMAGWIWTSAKGAARLDPSSSDYALQIAEPGAEDLGSALAFARAQPGVETVLLEAGPTAVAPLYAPAGDVVGAPLAELLLSRFEGALAPEAEGPPFVSFESWAERAGATSVSCERAEPSGPWRYERWRAGQNALGSKAG